MLAFAVGIEAQDMKQILLEDGTPVRLILNESVSSATAHTGDRVQFEVVEDVSVNGVLVIPRGSSATATVTKAESKKMMGRGGKLDINIDRVKLADGEKVFLRSVQGEKGGGHQAGMVTGIAITALVFWPAAPLFLLMKGKDITIPQGKEVTAFIQGEISLNAAKFTPQNQVTVTAPIATPAVTPMVATPTPAPVGPVAPSAMVAADPQTESLGDIARRYAAEKKQ
jgi:hypothetical protein